MLTHETCDHGNSICFDVAESADQFHALAAQAESNLAGLNDLFAEYGASPVA